LVESVVASPARAYLWSVIFTQSRWADFQVPALYLDEGTTGYTVAHNVMIDTPGWIAQIRTGTNPSGAQTTIAAAGIEPSYADIKTLTIPVPAF
jgi:hypothetical protein